MNLMDIVTQRPINEAPTDISRCPYCESTDTKVTSRSSTLMMFSGPVNPNHQWHESVCNGCKKTYTREIKGLNVWYTSERTRDGAAPQVLRGLPSCFERYQYTCAKCSGPVLKVHRDRAGNLAKALTIKWDGDRPVRQYTTHYNCAQCGHGGKVDHDYYQG